MADPPSTLSFVLNDTAVDVDPRGSLLDVLREQLGVTSAKDGCSPQGQCGCCTVLVDGQPRVACVTPAARIAGRRVTTLEGLADGPQWAERFVAHGASQCGFCTPGIIVRLAALPPARRTEPGVRDALLAHLCRCTGWQTIVEAALDEATPATEIDLRARATRAALEGGTAQHADVDTASGICGFASDTAPPGATVAVPAPDGTWATAASLAAARTESGAAQARRSTAALSWPVGLPDGDYTHVLHTTWVEPAALETDCSWCVPGGEPASSLANGGAFGAKRTGWAERSAARLATELGRPVVVRPSRADVVTLTPKRPPMAIGRRPDGGLVVIARRTPGIAAAIAAATPELRIDFGEVDSPGPPTSADLRGAGWAEIAAFVAAITAAEQDTDSCEVAAPNGAIASATIGSDGNLAITVECGDPLDDVMLRSYCIGAAHMALGLVRSEGFAVDDEGRPHDLTIRSFGILRATEMPHVDVEVVPSSDAPRNGSDAVFAAVAGAAWLHAGLPPYWPTMRT